MTDAILAEGQTIPSCRICAETETFHAINLANAADNEFAGKLELLASRAVGALVGSASNSVQTRRDPGVVPRGSARGKGTSPI